MRFFGTRRSSRLRGCLELNAPITRMSRITPSTPATISPTFTPFRRRDRSWVYMGMCEPRIVLVGGARMTVSAEGKSQKKRRDHIFVQVTSHKLFSARCTTLCTRTPCTCPRVRSRARRATRRAVPTRAMLRFASPPRHPPRAVHRRRRRRDALIASSTFRTRSIAEWRSRPRRDVHGSRWPPRSPPACWR